MATPKRDRDRYVDFDGTFAADDYLHFYAPMLTPERTEKEVDFYMAATGLAPGMRALDAACGHGRHANRLGAKGVEVVGVDLMKGFLDLAKAGKPKGAKVTYLRRDLRDLAFESEFDAASLLFTAFGYFDEAGNEAVLASLGRALKPGGRLLLDAPNRDAFLKHYQPDAVSRVGDDLMIDLHDWDPLEGRNRNTRITIRDGVRRETRFAIRLYNPTELVSIARRAGLALVRLHPAFEDAPFKPDAFRMVALFERKR